jgi:hypothetical protein
MTGGTIRSSAGLSVPVLAIVPRRGFDFLPEQFFAIYAPRR